MSRPPKSSVDPALKAAIGKLLAEVMKEPKEGEPAPSITDKVKVIDRALKLALIESKLSEAMFGSNFDPPDDDEPEG